jgi:hypothetical protein
MLGGGSEAFSRAVLEECLRRRLLYIPKEDWAGGGRPPGPSHSLPSLPCVSQITKAVVGV